MTLYNEAVLTKILGQTPLEVEMKEGEEVAVIRTVEGNELLLQYEHDCCASCKIVQIDGDPKDLLGAPLVMAEVITGESLGFNEDLDENGRDTSEDRWGDSHTWTFVKFATVKGYVTLRWYGSSNSYYSEEPTAYYNQADETGRRSWRFK